MSDKLQYDTPEILIEWFVQEDIICTSNEENEWHDENDGPWIPSRP